MMSNISADMKLREHQYLPEDGAVNSINCGYCEFDIPAGWQHKVYSDEIVLRKANTLVLIYSHSHSSLADLRRVMQCAPDDPSLCLLLESKPTQIADNAMVVNFIRESGNGKMLVSRLIGTISPFGGGAFIWTMDLSGELSVQMSEHADIIALGMRYSNIEDSDLVSFISGVYEDVEGNQFLLLRGGIFAKRIRGHHLAYSENAFQENVQVSGMAAECEPFGIWRVTGDRKQGNIIVTYEDNSSESIPFVVFKDSDVKPLKMKLSGRDVKPVPEFQQVEIMRRVNLIIENRQQDTIRR